MVSRTGRSSKKKVAVIVLGIVLIMSFFLAYGGGMNNLFRFFIPSSSSESNFQESKSKRILSAVQDESLVPDAAGTITLPDNLASASKDGKAYVTQSGDLLMVLLPVWRGKGSNLTGYLLCSRPLDAADMHSDEYEDKHNAVDVIVPVPTSGQTPPVKLGVKLERQLNGNIYYVSRQLD